MASDHQNTARKSSSGTSSRASSMSQIPVPVTPQRPEQETDESAVRQEETVAAMEKEHAHAENGRNKAPEEFASDAQADQELAPEYDWADFEERAAKIIEEANNVENNLLADFAALSDAFAIWAQASQQQDNERAVKRLKTRERYVVLSEEALKEKRKHYTTVVGAFQAALALFKD